MFSSRCINNDTADGITPLCCASLWGNESMAKFLLENGANVNATNEGMSRPQHLD